jgi:hypothetical protein
LSDPNFRQQPRAPEFFSKPRQQWTEKDLIEYSDWRIEQGLQRASDDQRARGLYSEHTLGKGNDYDSVVNTYLAPLTRQNPEIAPFLQMLGPEDRYMLGLLHEVHAKSNGNLVQTIRAIRNAIGARTEGAKDVTKAIQNATKGAALKVVQGAGGRQTAQQPRTAQDVWNMSEDDFRAEVNRRS